MKDDFDERLAARLRFIDGQVPPFRIKEGTMSAHHRTTRLSSGFPVGLVAALVTIVVVLVGSSMILRGGQVAANPSVGASAVATVASSPSVASGMIVIDAKAAPFAGSGNPVRVVALIENRTSRDEKLISASSPLAASGGIYATSGAFPVSTDPSGMGNLRPMPWWLVRAGESIQLRAGDGEIVLNGLTAPVVPGQQIEVTFGFEDSPSVTILVPIVASVS